MFHSWTKFNDAEFFRKREKTLIECYLIKFYFKYNRGTHWSKLDFFYFFSLVIRKYDSLTMTCHCAVGRVHTLMVVPSSPLRSRWVQEERAHVLSDAGVNVRRDGPLGGGALVRRAHRIARARRLVPSRGAFVGHLHNHLTACRSE